MKIQKHRSWKNIIPTHREKKDFGLYSKRILGTFPNTNDNIIKEWFFQQCEIPRVASNYCWIDLSKIVCSERYITVDEVLNIYIPESGIARFNSLKDLKELDITLRKKDKKSWEENGSWTSPPVLLLIESIGNAPEYMDVSLDSKYQLIEGFSRLGWFHAFYNNINKNGTLLKKKHLVLVVGIQKPYAIA